MKTYMMTAPRKGSSKREIYKMMSDLDAKKWIIARETGKSGYEHWQCRFTLSGDLRRWVEDNGLGWHVEDANEVWEYEQKGGDYWCSWDTVETLKFRRSKLRESQIRLMGSVDNQNDRMVTIWIDRKGGFGKTFTFLRGVMEGTVLPVPAVAITPIKLGGWIKSALQFAGGRARIIWIDIPRAAKIPSELWATIEELKGICYEHRYASSWQITIGMKILVTTNNELSKEDLKQLSADRWDIHYIEELIDNPTSNKENSR